MSDQVRSEQDRLQDELERAYRALRGIYGVIANGRMPQRSTLAYHAMAIGAAIRFVDEGSLDGAEYFVGKPIAVLQEALAKVQR